MSELTPEQILQMIEDHGGPQRLNLSGKDLSGINLSGDWIREEMKRRGLTADNPPVWFSPGTRGINLQGAELWEANLQTARLQGADLQGAYLLEANLQGAWLVWANLQDAFLVGANLQGADLVRADLVGAWLVEANLQGASLEGANLLRTPLTAACLGGGVGEEMDKHWELARQVYRTLKVNFLSLGQYDDARWAVIREHRMGRRAYRPWLEAKAPPAGKGFQRRAWREVEWVRLHPVASAQCLLGWLADISTDYLTNPYKVAFLLLPTAVIFFTLLYRFTGSWGWGDSLIFSGRTLVTLAFSDMTPGNLWAKVLSPIEGAVGVSLFALFVYCLGRRTAGY